MKPLPELYAYIFRNVLKDSGNLDVVSSQSIFKSIRKVVYKAPAFVYRTVIDEFKEDYNVLVKLNKTHFRIHLNKKVKNQLRKLNEHIFPIKV